MNKETLNQDFTDFIAALNKHGVEYVVIGGYAVGFHGYIRATEDLDVFVRRELENVRKLKAAVEEFCGINMDDRHFMQEKTLLHIGPEATGIDVLNYFVGADEDRVLKTAVTADVGGLTIRFPSLECLIENKRAAGRDTDAIDVRHLQTVQQELEQKRARESRSRGGLEL